MSLSPRARALFRSAAARHEPRKEDAERILSLLGPKLAAAATVAAGTTIAASAAGAAGSAAKAGAAGTAGTAAAKVATVALSTKILAAVGIASAVAMGALEYETTRPASSAVPVVASSSPASPRPLVSPAEARPSARRPHALAEPPSNDAPTAIPVPPALTTPATPATPATPTTPTTPATLAARAARGAPAAAPGATNVAPVALAAVVAPATSTTSTLAATAEITPAASIAAELALLRQSQQELRSGDASAALATLDVHARRHPAGALGQERMATRVFVLCALGRTVEASATADAFLSAHPTSPHASRVRTSCARMK